MGEEAKGCERRERWVDSYSSGLTRKSFFSVGCKAKRTWVGVVKLKLYYRVVVQFFQYMKLAVDMFTVVD